MATPAFKKFTRKELESRNTENDALFVIDNTVYDVTDYLDEHPGGQQVMMEHAGGDATEAFDDAGHSADAREIMMKYRVGEVVEDDRREVVRRRAVSWDGSGDAKWNWCVTRWLLVPVAVGILATVILYRCRH